MHWFYKFLSSFPNRHIFWGNSICCIWQLPNEVICTWLCTLEYDITKLWTLSGLMVRVQSRRLACSNSFEQFNQYIVSKALWSWTSLMEHTHSKYRSSDWITAKQFPCGILQRFLKLLLCYSNEACDSLNLLIDSFVHYFDEGPSAKNGEDSNR